MEYLGRKKEDFEITEKEAKHLDKYSRIMRIAVFTLFGEDVITHEDLRNEFKKRNISPKKGMLMIMDRMSELEWMK